MFAKNLNAVDLFCGGGGISAGLRDAGFCVHAGIDIDQKCLATFQHNFEDARTLHIDLTRYSPGEVMQALGISPGEVDLVAGGPPCQGFSKNVPRKLRSSEDASNFLVHTFLDYCEAFAPRLILMENVAEMRNGFARQFSNEVLYRLSHAGYAVTPFVVNAAEYGIPQNRRRAFFLAAKYNGALTLPMPTHINESLLTGLADKVSPVTVWEAIGDLPSIRHGEGEALCEYACPPFSDYQKGMRNTSGEVRNHIARRLAPKQYARLEALQPGQGHKDLPAELKVRGGYSGAYGRLTKDMVAPTITRWMFHPGSGRWGHPVDVRTLTIREAARIQGFSDCYEFVGSFVQQASQIGNATPPLLIKQIALAMRAQLGI